MLIFVHTCRAFPQGDVLVTSNLWFALRSHGCVHHQQAFRRSIGNLDCQRLTFGNNDENRRGCPDESLNGSISSSNRTSSRPLHINLARMCVWIAHHRDFFVAQGGCRREKRLFTSRTHGTTIKHRHFLL